MKNQIKNLLFILPIFMFVSCSNKDEQTITKTFNFKNEAPTCSTFDVEKSQQTFISWFNEKAENDILVGIDTKDTFVQINNVGGYSTLILGSQKNTGEMSFVFNIKIKQITFSVSPYHKYNSYNDTWNIDNNAKFVVNNNDSFDLSTTATAGPLEDSSITINYQNIEKYSLLSISNKDMKQRVFVNSMILTWYK